MTPSSKPPDPAPDELAKRREFNRLRQRKYRAHMSPEERERTKELQRRYRQQLPVRMCKAMRMPITPESIAYAAKMVRERQRILRLHRVSGPKKNPKSHVHNETGHVLSDGATGEPSRLKRPPTCMEDVAREFIAFASFSLYQMPLLTCRQCRDAVEKAKGEQGAQNVVHSCTYGLVTTPPCNGAKGSTTCNGIGAQMRSTACGTTVKMVGSVSNGSCVQMVIGTCDDIGVQTSSAGCNGNGVQKGGSVCNGNCIHMGGSTCNGNGVQISGGVSDGNAACNGSGVPMGASACNGNGVQMAADALNDSGVQMGGGAYNDK
ncbi:uncharacterized protein LOC18436854 [Amborella trichopoda]|uniref:Uncharacterized protein n=1 Tax=Amborella trichopoda TaxID=13333 RepID=W1PNI6_AMBTC|nr:uncharacterized protein LOC18436854 [Amborella trichopoda]XP_011624363.1 uncharacterized protein LOC18436854 [Amborella trichopoda]XP_020524512.1 uncharacterized protein LOC18436854 [Amborella trichopoda]XP_020524513.1 uncharacterized protein LOC18436854 [Amborella trichopoda]XP_020524514.1 uncharacterized protein LOC18436854 [Amborella trichopoda]ERN08720.1 hypothetical protein AMTR_s00017p00236990 [Amborella trichopoda]|eukprot:XP_006847139.1 uncharacterized protein LOC18436854 [Amborella trichopoda]